MQNRTISPARRRVSFVFALLLVAGVITAAFLALDQKWHWAGVGARWRLYVTGWLSTLAIASIALPLSCVLGVAFAFARRAAFLPLRYAAQICVEVTRGAPLLVQIYLYFYVFAQVLHISDLDVSVLGLIHIHIPSRYILGPFILATFAGAYISELIRAGIESVGRSQLESARSIGLTTVQTYRHVIFPQAIRQVLPGLAGQFVSLVKDSSLLSIIAINEFTMAGSNTAAYTAATFESYLPLAAGYLIITVPISLWTQRLEQRVKFDT